jgi:hypothetical protein
MAFKQTKNLQKILSRLDSFNFFLNSLCLLKTMHYRSSKFRRIIGWLLYDQRKASFSRTNNQLTPIKNSKFVGVFLQI